jgi:polyisoprenoid-binding protein YceI
MSEPATTDVASLLTDGTVAGTWALDPAGSRAEFRVKHFEAAITESPRRVRRLDSLTTRPR